MPRSNRPPSVIAHVSPEGRFLRINSKFCDIVGYLLVDDLRELKAGRPVPHLTYDHAAYTRRVLSDPLPPRPVLLLEGILILAEESLRRIMDIKLFIDTDPDVRILRRRERDIAERGRSFATVSRQYLESVRPMHLEFVEPSKR